MHKFINALYEVYCADMTPEQQMANKAAEQYFDRLCQVVGNQEADDIWFAAMGVGQENDLHCFTQGLRLGAQLMRWVLEEG